MKFDTDKLAFLFMNIIEDLICFRLSSSSVSPKEHVRVIISEEKLSQRLILMQDNLNEAILLKEIGFAPNEFIDFFTQKPFSLKK